MKPAFQCLLCEPESTLVELPVVFSLKFLCVLKLQITKKMDERNATKREHVHFDEWRWTLRQLWALQVNQSLKNDPILRTFFSSMFYNVEGSVRKSVETTFVWVAMYLSVYIQPDYLLIKTLWTILSYIKIWKRNF